MPLSVGQELYGVIGLYYRLPRSFSDEDISLASSFGDQAALAIENTRLREQVALTAVAAERSRLARDLHDSVTQSLFAANINAEALAGTWQPSSADARRCLADVQRLTRGALAEMRTLLLEMRPAALAQASLDDLLRHLVEAVDARTRISVGLTVTSQHTLPPDVTIALYRIAQEALNNVVRHSRAQRAWVEVRCSAAGAWLEVGDNGRGFDPSSVGPEQLGLGIMRERAESVGARLTFETAPRRGTVVTAAWSDQPR